MDGIEFRLPYNSDPLVRDKINSGHMEYFDMHLSQVAPMAWQGFLGPLDTAVIEIAGIRPDGGLIPSSSVGNNKTWLDRARQVILEVNSWQNAALEGMHDIYYGTRLPPHRVPIPLTRPASRRHRLPARGCSGCSGFFGPLFWSPRSPSCCSSRSSIRRISGSSVCRSM